MKKVFFALISVFFGINSVFADENAEKYRQQCLDFINEPKVELLSSYGRLRYNFDKDSAYLKDQARRKRVFSVDENKDNYETMGFTKVNDVFDMDFSVAQLSLGYGYTCVYPEAIKAKLEYIAPTIYVANNIKKNTCLYYLTLRHEKTHMQIYIEALDYFLPKLKSYMVSQLKKTGVVIVPKGEDAQKAAEKLSQTYLQGVQEKIDEWRKEVEAEQYKLDTPEQYILESRICDNDDLVR